MTHRNALHNATWSFIGFLVCAALAVIGNWMGFDMRELIEAVAYLLVLLAWLAGITIAKGVVSTTLAILVPPYAWYLIVEVVVKRMGLI